MTREDRAARSAFVLAAALFLASLPWPERLEPACESAREAEAREGRSVRVRCDGIGPPLRGPARLLFGQKLDPNRASARTLEVLPGLGPARAGAIVAARSERPFERVEDLRRVPGIGPVTLEKIAPWLEVAPRAAPGAPLQQNR